MERKVQMIITFPDGDRKRISFSSLESANKEIRFWFQRAIERRIVLDCKIIDKETGSPKCWTMLNGKSETIKTIWKER